MRRIDDCSFESVEPNFHSDANSNSNSDSFTNSRTTANAFSYAISNSQLCAVVF